jgi:hypothetical protein
MAFIPCGDIRRGSCANVSQSLVPKMRIARLGNGLGFESGKIRAKNAARIGSVSRVHDAEDATQTQLEMVPPCGVIPSRGQTHPGP